MAQLSISSFLLALFLSQDLHKVGPVLKRMSAAPLVRRAAISMFTALFMAGLGLATVPIMVKLRAHGVASLCVLSPIAGYAWCFCMATILYATLGASLCQGPMQPATTTASVISALIVWAVASHSPTMVGQLFCLEASLLFLLVLLAGHANPGSALPNTPWRAQAKLPILLSTGVALLWASALGAVSFA
jgi:hypothetical protein